MAGNHRHNIGGGVLLWLLVLTWSAFSQHDRIDHLEQQVTRLQQESVCCAPAGDR